MSGFLPTYAHFDTFRAGLDVSFDVVVGKLRDVRDPECRTCRSLDRMVRVCGFHLGRFAGRRLEGVGWVSFEPRAGGRTSMLVHGMEKSLEPLYDVLKGIGVPAPVSPPVTEGMETSANIVRGSAPEVAGRVAALLSGEFSPHVLEVEDVDPGDPERRHHLDGVLVRTTLNDVLRDILPPGARWGLCIYEIVAPKRRDSRRYGAKVELRLRLPGGEGIPHEFREEVRRAMAGFVRALMAAVKAPMAAPGPGQERRPYETAAGRSTECVRHVVTAAFWAEERASRKPGWDGTVGRPLLDVVVSLACCRPMRSDKILEKLRRCPVLEPATPGNWDRWRVVRHPTEVLPGGEAELGRMLRGVRKSMPLETHRDFEQAVRQEIAARDAEGGERRENSGGGRGASEGEISLRPPQKSPLLAAYNVTVAVPEDRVLSALGLQAASQVGRRGWMERESRRKEDDIMAGNASAKDMKAGNERKEGMTKQEMALTLADGACRLFDRRRHQAGFFMRCLEAILVEDEPWAPVVGMLEQAESPSTREEGRRLRLFLASDPPSSDVSHVVSEMRRAGVPVDVLERERDFARLWEAVFGERRVQGVFCGEFRGVAPDGVAVPVPPTAPQVRQRSSTACEVEAREENTMGGGMSTSGVGGRGDTSGASSAVTKEEMALTLAKRSRRLFRGRPDQMRFFELCLGVFDAGDRAWKEIADMLQVSELETGREEAKRVESFLAEKPQRHAEWHAPAQPFDGERVLVTGPAERAREILVLTLWERVFGVQTRQGVFWSAAKEG